MVLFVVTRRATSQFVLQSSQHCLYYSSSTKTATQLTASLLKSKQSSSLYHSLWKASSSSFASSSSLSQKTTDPRLESATVHIRGEKYGSRKYILLPQNLSIDESNSNDDDNLVESTIDKSKLASLRANRNMLFGARVHVEDLSLSLGCNRLLDIALLDASEHGEQPQAIAALYGLCDWVSKCLEQEGESEELVKIIKKRDETGDDTTYEAIKAIATGIPRPGHSVVGVGTFRDGQKGWEALAKEYATTQDDLAEEAALYRSKGGEITTAEHLADRSEAYIRSAGGAMVRVFFL